MTTGGRLVSSLLLLLLLLPAVAWGGGAAAYQVDEGGIDDKLSTTAFRPGQQSQPVGGPPRWLVRNKI